MPDDEFWVVVYIKHCLVSDACSVHSHYKIFMQNFRLQNWGCMHGNVAKFALYCSYYTIQYLLV